MRRYRHAKVDARYLLFSELYSVREEPKCKRKSFAILEAAINCYAKKGRASVTIEMIAREAGVSRSLINYYYPNPDEIFEITIKYIRLLFQKIAIEALMREEHADKKLHSYVQACFEWADIFKKHAYVYIELFHLCATNSKLKKLNTLAAAVGEDRITHLLELGQKQGVFDRRSTQGVAKAIQSVITGGLIMKLTENLEEPQAFAKNNIQLCLNLAGALPEKKKQRAAATSLPSHHLDI